MITLKSLVVVTTQNASENWKPNDSLYLPSVSVIMKSGVTGIPFALRRGLGYRINILVSDLDGALRCTSAEIRTERDLFAEERRIVSTGFFG